MRPPWALTAGVLLFFSLIVLAPIGYMLSAPFLTEGAGDVSSYRGLFDSRHLSLGFNSLSLALGTTVLSLVIGVPLAFLLLRTDLWGRRSFRIVYLIPILIPPYIHAIVWTHFFRQIKPIVSVDFHTLGGAMGVLGIAYFPFITLMTLAGLKMIDRSMEEVSLLYHGKWHTLFHITRPLLIPHIFSGAVFVFIFAIIDFGVPDVFRIRVYPIEIFIQFSAFYDARGACILSVPIILITFSLIFLQKWVMKNRSYVNVSGGFSNGIQYSLGKLQVAAFGFCLLMMGLSVGLPILSLIHMAGPISTYERVLKTSMDQIAYSVVLAVAGAGLAVALGFLISYLIERVGGRMKNPLLFLSILPLAIPATTFGIGMIHLWNRPGLDMIFGSSAIILLAYVARFLPFTVLALQSNLKQVHRNVEEAAFLSTSHWLRVVRKIVLPMIKPGMLTGFFIVFILSIGELGATLLVIPPGKETIPIKIYNLMHYGAENMVAALCLMLIMGILGVAGVFLLLFRKAAQ